MTPEAPRMVSADLATSLPGLTRQSMMSLNTEEKD
jgi:hypothetical protein